MHTKKEIRRKICGQREQLSRLEQEWKARECTRRVLLLESFQRAKTIAIYISYRGEMRTEYLIEEARRSKKRVAAPKILGKNMEFFYFDSKEELEENKYGILEPTSKEKLEEDALLILPGVAFDEERNRIGYGGGFYDRYMETYPDCKSLAIGYDFQVLPQIPREEFDQKPGAIVTEKRVIW